MTGRVRIVLLLSLFLGLLQPAEAAATTSEALGKVTDAQDNPIVGAVVTFVNAGDAKASYEATTDKRGRYSISGLLYVAPGVTWNVGVKAAGFVQSKIKVDSSTQSQTVARFDANLRPDGSKHAIPIRPLGRALVDFVMVPGDVDALAAAAAQAGKPVVANPSAKASLLEQAAQKVADGDDTGAVELFQKAIEENPQDAARRLEFSRVLYKLEKYKEAEVQAEKAAELAPGTAGPNRVLANIYYKNDEFDKAARALAKERKIAPNDPAVLSLVATLAEETGHPEEAIGAYQSLVTVNPQNTQAWLGLGNLYARQNQLDKSEEAYRKVTELDPTNAHQTFYNIGAVIMNKPSPSQADTQKAVAAFRKAIELKPAYAAAYKELGYALLNLGQLEDARTALEKYLELEPKSPDAAQLRDTLKSLPKKK